MTRPVVGAPRTCLIGGETRSRSLFGPTLSAGRLLVVLPLLALGLVALVVVQSAWLLAAEVALGVAGWRLLTRRDDQGEAWTGSATDRLRWWVERRTGTNVYAPATLGEGRPLPPEVGSLRVLAYAAPASQGAPLAICEHGGGGPTPAYRTATLEIVGGGDGLREVGQVNDFGARIGRLLMALARPELPVDQIDVATRVTPVDAAAYRRWLAERVDPAAPRALREAIWELAEQVSFSGEAYRSFLTVCMPTAALAVRAARRDRVGEEGLAAVAYDAVGTVVRTAQAAGWAVRAGLGPRRLAALIRHTYNPSFDLDDQRGLTGVADGFQPYTNTESYLRCGVGSQQYCHAVASVPRDGWPLSPVGVRWLDGLVSGVTPATVRTVAAQLRLVPRAQAREEALAAHTLDEADRRGRAKRARVSTGQEEAQSSASRRVLDDLLHSGAAGCRPALRVLVSARTPQELAEARERVSTVAGDSRLNRLAWHDTRHHHGMLLALPLGRGIPR